mgnify:CR=1 FL=1
MSVLDALIKARDHISDPAMWYKGGYSDDGRTGAEDGFPCCAMGALVWVNPDVGIFCNDAYRPLRDALPAEWTSIPYFNDAPATTHADILALFDRAIAAERAKIGGAL